jgi:hypothetical protein
MLALSMSITFFIEPSSRFKSWMWSSWMRTVFSTMPSLAPAIRSVKGPPLGVGERDRVERFELSAEVSDELSFRRDPEIVARLRLQELNELPL